MFVSAIFPDWPAPHRVRALVTTRAGGVSRGPYAAFNLAAHVGDASLAVAENRRLLRRELPAEPLWLNQVHGAAVVDAATTLPGIAADASYTRMPGIVCAVLTADCLPVLFCDQAGSVVAAVHAGWRGLAAGVLEATVAALGVAPAHLLVWLGPAIGPCCFEVGRDVWEAFCRQDAGACDAFRATREGHWQADLYRLARHRLAAQGVCRIYGGGLCTACDAKRFYSYRRERVTGRMASLVWLAPD